MEHPTDMLRRGFMSFFVTIGQQSFEVPDTVTIGRGEPFTVLNNHWEVSRAHLQISRKKDQWIIRDLDSGSGTFVNESRIPINQDFTISESDRLLIGGVEMKVMVGRPQGEVFVVVQSTMDFALFHSKLRRNYFFMAIGTGLFHLFKHDRPISVITVTLAMLVAVFTFLLAYPVSLAAIRFFRKKMINEIFFSEEGFTIHYFGGTNMTFKRDKLQAWTIKNKKLIILKIYDEYHFIQTFGQFTLLKDYLKTNLPKIENKYTIRPHLGILLALLGLIDFIVNKDITWIFTGSATAILLMLLFNRKLMEYWPIPVSRTFNSRNRRRLVMAAAAYLAFITLADLDADRTRRMANESQISKKVERSPASLQRP